MCSRVPLSEADLQNYSESDLQNYSWSVRLMLHNRELYFPMELAHFLRKKMGIQKKILTENQPYFVAYTKGV